MVATARAAGNGLQPEEGGVDAAVVGMACRFAGAHDPEQFWGNLINGVDSIIRFPSQPISRAVGDGDDDGPRDLHYTPARGLLQEPEWFDPGYFGYSPGEARIIDPQQRVLLECAVEALERAGYDPARFPGTIGFYAGGGDTSYAAVLRSEHVRRRGINDLEIRLATGVDFLGSRIAYKLDVHGPVVTVQAACASSLVAVHLAVQGLLAGDCDLALAGGASVHVPLEFGEYTEGGILSADGVCRAFDADANGIVEGDGAGLVVLRRLDDAVADGDHIHAIIRGSAVNNDGSGRVGYTAPSIDGQAAVIRAAHQVACVDADTITYVEAHGAGTPLGDPIEVAALIKAFAGGDARGRRCWLGSVKTNIGHTDAAAGVAGLIKAVMAAEHGQIPPNLHFSQPNPDIDFAAGPFRVATELHDWQPQGIPRRAGVSSFGLGGTNAHVVVEEPPPPRSRPAAGSWHILPISARSPAALDAATARLTAHLRSHPELRIDDVAWTLQVGRAEHPFRRCALVRGHADALRLLGSRDSERLLTAGVPVGKRRVVFVFLGSANADAAIRQICADEPVARRAFEECWVHAGPELVANPPAAILARSAGPPGGQPGGQPPAADVSAFALEYAMASLWNSWGLKPAAVTGTGLGLLVAAVVAGALDVPDAVRLILGRAANMAGRRGSRQPVAEDAARAARRNVAQVPMALNGRWITPADLGDPAWWAEFLRNGPFPADVLGAFGEEPDWIPLGAGTAAPGCNRDLGGLPEQPLLPLPASGALSPGDVPARLAAVARFWLSGAEISWPRLHGPQRPRRVSLPTYPFERQRCIVETTGPGPGGATAVIMPSHPPVDAAAADGNGLCGAGRPAPGATVAGTIRKLFAEYLGLAEIDADESFFDLGGDSLIGTRLVAQIRQVFPVGISLRALYEAPTPSQFAALVAGELTSRRDPAGPDEAS